jgi:hypothetical protein
MGCCLQLSGARVRQRAFQAAGVLVRVDPAKGEVRSIHRLLLTMFVLRGEQESRQRPSGAGSDYLYLAGARIPRSVAN